MPFSGSDFVIVFYFEMSDVILKKLSTIHFQLSIALGG